MRPVICALLALSASATVASAATELTIILQFDGRHSDLSVSEMKRELQSLMRDSGTALSWRNSAELAAGESFPRVVVARFHGSCQMMPLAAPLLGDGEPLGYSHISNGEMIPFADVECDRVRAELRTRHGAPGDDLTLGRAMGRILAHELHHIIDHTRTHARTGIMRKSLSPQDLIAARTL